MKKARCFADGGAIGADGLTDAQRARLSGARSNLGVSNAPPPPAPVQVPVQAPAPQPQQNAIASGIIGILGNRNKQIDKAAGYANGGKIQGIGTPTSDSIDASVEETGEPIKVSTKERIVSHEQDKLLQRLAKAMGFASVDAFFEAGTGKPVGPTIKGGKRGLFKGGEVGTNNNVEDEFTRSMQAMRNNLSIPSLGTNNAAAQGGIYKDVGLPSISMGAGQAPTIYDNGGLDAGTVQRGIDTMRSQLADGKPQLSAPVVEAGRQAIAGQVATQPPAGPKQWYSGTDSSDPRTGLEMERERRSQATAAGVMNDPVKSALQYGVVGSASQQGIAGIASPSAAASAPQATESSNYGNEGRSVPTPITKTNPGAVVDNEFKVGGKTYNVNNTSQQGITRVTAPGTSPLYTNINPEQAVSGLKNQMIGSDSEGLARYAKAVAINKERIDAQPTGGIAILGDETAQDRENAEKTARWRRDDLVSLASRGNQGAVIAAINADQQASMEPGRREVALRGQDANYAATIAGQGITARGQDIASLRAAGHDQTLMRGQDITGKNDAERNRILAEQANAKSPNYKDRYIALPNRKTYNDMGQVTGEEPGGIFDAATGQPVGVQKQVAGAKPSYEQFAAQMKQRHGDKATDAAMKQAYAQQFGA